MQYNHLHPSMRPSTGITWDRVWNRCECSDAVAMYDPDARSIQWAGESDWQDFDRPIDAFTAITEMEEGNGDVSTSWIFSL